MYLNLLINWVRFLWASHVVQMVKNLPANEGDIRDIGLIPEFPMDRGAWWATVHRVTEIQTN